jgi:hypothetical protein
VSLPIMVEVNVGEILNYLVIESLLLYSLMATSSFHARAGRYMTLDLIRGRALITFHVRSFFFFSVQRHPFWIYYGWYVQCVYSAESELRSS